MASAQLSQQLAQLSESLRATNALITKLSKLSFQPGSEPLNSEHSVRLELSQDIHESLKQLEEDLELLKQEAEDLSAVSRTHTRRDSERQREGVRLGAQVLRLGEDLRHSRGHFRRAQLTAKKASEAAKQKEREVVFASLQSAPDPSTANWEQQPDLFAGRSKRQHQQKHLTKDELELQASTDVTAALRRTHNLLSTELSRSRFAQETFEESTAALAQLGDTYTDLGSVIDKSRDLLGNLLRSQKSDTWYLETAFYILLATLCWLVFRRLLFGPFIKLPLFFWRSSLFLLNWILLKPLFLFLSVTGVITTQPATQSTTRISTSISSSRTPLIVQPSATGGVPKLPISQQLDMQKRGGVPAGVGGAGAKIGKDGKFDDKAMEEIAQRHEQSQQDAAKGQAQPEPGEGVVRRGDGTILQDRGDVPKNPKKKTFDAEAGDGRERDEL